MTRQEKKQELIALFTTGAMPIGELIDDCFAFADANPHWISVEDELPKDSGGFYLSVDKNGEIWYRQYTKLYGWRSMVGNMFISGWDVTHWMHLPQAPKKGGEQ